LDNPESIATRQVPVRGRLPSSAKQRMVTKRVAFGELADQAIPRIPGTSTPTCPVTLSWRSVR
jgi:hypothetical protein